MKFLRGLAFGLVLAPEMLGAQVIEWKVAYEDKPQFPYYLEESVDVPQAKPGIAVEMVQALEQRLPQFKVELSRMPWKRCLSDLKEGKVDAIFYSSFKTERLEFGVYPMNGEKPDANLRMTTLSYSLYKLKDSPVQWDGKAFTNLNEPVGAPLGYSIVDDLKQMGVTVEESKSTDMILKKLLIKRLAAVAAQDLTADVYLKSSPEFKEVVKVTPPLVTKDYYLMMSHQFVKNHTELSKKIWEELAKMRDQQEQFVKKYLE